MAFSLQINNAHHEINDLYLEMFYLALSYFLRGYPPNIFAADAFHNRVRDGSEWFHIAMNTRIEIIPKV